MPELHERLLQSIPLFKALSSNGLTRLLQAAVVHSIAAGTTLFEQGDPPSVQHIVLSGSVRLFGRSDEGHDVLIDVVAAPDLVIPAAVATGAPYLMQARVAEPSQILLIPARAFQAVVRDEPALAQELIGSLARQFRRMVRQIKNLKLRSSTQRVGCYILALAARQGTPGRAVLPYEKNLIASELGITRESFSRALAALHAVGIAVHGDTIVIGDPAAMAALCRPDPLIDGPDPESQMLRATG